MCIYLQTSAGEVREPIREDFWCSKDCLACSFTLLIFYVNIRIVFFLFVIETRAQREEVCFRARRPGHLFSSPSPLLVYSACYWFTLLVLRSSLLSKIKSFLAVCAMSIPCLFEFNRSRQRHTYVGGYDTPLHPRIPPHSQFSKGCACVRTTVRSVKPRSMYCLLSACPCPSSAALSSLRPRAHNGPRCVFRQHRTMICLSTMWAAPPLRSKGPAAGREQACRAETGAPRGFRGERARGAWASWRRSWLTRTRGITTTCRRSRQGEEGARRLGRTIW